MGRGYVQQVFIKQKYVGHMLLDRCDSGVGLARGGVSNLGAVFMVEKGDSRGAWVRWEGANGGRSDLCGDLIQSEPAAKGEEGEEVRESREVAMEAKLDSTEHHAGKRAKRELLMCHKSPLQG
ncbi:unnamed protein product [Citrullus colocynthis]|uniref:Uncharacterized protein n=1 Tax=Citrullus colocynthis TaxID=252529 RepID=A0ABP0YMZ6_9ROSI